MTSRSLTQIRSDSRNALPGNYTLCFAAIAIMLTVEVALTQLSFLLPLPSTGGVVSVLLDILCSIPATLVMTMLQTGFIFLTLNIARYSHPTINDLFLAFRYDPLKAVGLCLVLGVIDIICMLPVSYALTNVLLALMNLTQGGTLAALNRSFGYLVLAGLITIVLRVLISYPFSQALMLYIDHQEYSGTQCLTKSARLMRGNIFRYFRLEISFIGYLLLSCISFGIGLIWVIPYINVARANFYMDLTGTYKPY